MNRNIFNECILEANFRELFITELGWNKPKGNPRLVPIVIDDMEFAFTCVAERNGFQVLVADVDSIPTNSLSRRIDVQLRKQAQDYIAIYKARDRHGHHAWVVPIKNVDKRDLVSIEYESPSQAEFLLQKLDNIQFDTQSSLTIIDVKEGVNRAFAVNSEKITKDFYSGFRKEHTSFAKLIKGIDDNIPVKENHNKQWYASVMLNRLMFCYFIQKKGFLDGNVNYLRDKLQWVREKQGENQFFGTFYREFLRRLFSDGLNAPHHNQEFTDKFGRIPYLNGGMFDTHQLEREYADIDISDDAFKSLFTFFDKWKWHLDTRVTASGKDINPDVLGYIFEQYVNDRAQMGAYYTKEDITEYIGRNCILPFLFDEVKRTAKDEGNYFAPDGYVWRTLRDSRDRYVFDAVKKGFYEFDEIPENIRRGIITDDMRNDYAKLSVNELPDGHIPLAELRSDWNTKTPERWALPTEVWRETIERLQRCGEILQKIEQGEITSINDFITYNLDIRSFAYDLLAKADSKFVGRFYKTLQKVTILDPTCGSGAFLFAAMNILEPLYEICIERMQEFNAKNSKHFEKELGEINNRYRSNIQYFIYKSIILRNLYGVDIMVEATEIAKLRLFLKMVAVVDVDPRADNLGLDPLPDIDFNIRCGNTLVGYATKTQLERDLSFAQTTDEMEANEDFKKLIEEEMRKVSSAYKVFKDLQLTQEEDMVAFKKAKQELRVKQSDLNEKLNLRLYKANPTMSYSEWLKSHQPFHWIAEFYEIMASESDGGNGGFDVIIGNPPYVVYNPKNFIYKVDANYATIDSANLYAFCIERSNILHSDNGFVSMIVPVAISNGIKLGAVRKVLTKGSLWILNFSGDTHPGTLFNGVQQNVSIFISTNDNNVSEVYSSDFIRFFNMARVNLFTTVRYIDNINSNNGIIKISSNVQKSLIAKINEQPSPISAKFANSSISGQSYIVKKTTSGSQYKLFFKDYPFFSIDGMIQKSSSFKPIYFFSEEDAWRAIGIFNSNLFNLWWVSLSDGRNVTSKETDSIKVPESLWENGELISKSKRLIEDLKSNSTRVIYNKAKGVTEYDLYTPRKSKTLIDCIDVILSHHYGFTEEELDFIINYDIKYRMGDELNNADE